MYFTRVLIFYLFTIVVYSQLHEPEEDFSLITLESLQVTSKLTIVEEVDVHVSPSATPTLSHFVPFESIYSSYINTEAYETYETFNTKSYSKGVDVEVGSNIRYSVVLNQTIFEDITYGPQTEEYILNSHFNKKSNKLFQSNIVISSELESKRIARYAGAAYCSDATLKQWVCHHCKALGSVVTIIDIFYHKDTKGRGFIAIDDRKSQIILSFRGSSNLKNWITNLNFRQMHYNVKGGDPKMKVHTGFKNAIDALFPLFSSRIEKLLIKYPDHALIVTGHSLGGALANLATIELQQHLNLPWGRIQLFTYGSPRVGNKAFALWLNSKYLSSTRVVFNRDIVPHLPPRILEYVHYQRELHIYKNRAYVCSDEALEDEKCSLARAPILSINDHLTYWDVRLGGIC